MANCLYNGLELPALPEWDKETYPYALIIDENRYELYLFKRFTAYEHHPNIVDTPQWFNLSTSGSYDSTDGYLYANYNEAENKWGELKTDPSDPATNFISNILWASVDIRDYNNALYLSASDPIPVNPAPTLDPTALLMGWQAGNGIARQRV